jgi:hypothetical protein
MRVRFYMEVELSDEALIKQFGERLPQFTADQNLHRGIVSAAEKLLGSLPAVHAVKGCIIPDML